MSVHPFLIHIPQSTLDDLDARLRRTRWAEDFLPSGWERGTDPDYLKELVTYWQQRFVSHFAGCETPGRGRRRHQPGPCRYHQEGRHGP
jgi:hypothetical protein